MMIGMMLSLPTSGCNVQSRGSSELLSRIDHLVYGTPDVQRTVEELAEALGIRATLGGQHLGHGTRNAVIALGPSTYLEILGPDPDQPEPQELRWLGIDDLTAPRLLTWAATDDDLKQLVRDAAQQGIALGEVRPGSRTRSDGVVLSWHLTDPRQFVADGIVPFFIDWGNTPHPALSAAQGATLINLDAEHPDPQRVRRILAHLGLDLRVRSGPAPALVATIRTPRGTIELR